MDEFIKELTSKNELLEKELNENKLNLDKLQKQADNALLVKKQNEQRLLW